MLGAAVAAAAPVPQPARAEVLGLRVGALASSPRDGPSIFSGTRAWQVIRPRAMGKTASRAGRAKPLSPLRRAPGAIRPRRPETPLAAAPMATAVLCVGLCGGSGALY